MEMQCPSQLLEFKRALHSCLL